jgi:hypothetical protein
MFKRALLLAVMLIFPLGALADDETTPTDPAATPQAQATPSDASSAGLGPDTVAPNGGSPTGSSAALQPAGQAPLQSTTNDSTGLTAPQNALQAPATSSEDLKVLDGEADGAPQDPNESKDSAWRYLALAFLIFVLVWGFVSWRERRRSNASARGESISERPQTAPDQVMPEAEIADDNQAADETAEPQTQSEPEVAPAVAPETRTEKPKKPSKRKRGKRH